MKPNYSKWPVIKFLLIILTLTAVLTGIFIHLYYSPIKLTNQLVINLIIMLVGSLITIFYIKLSNHFDAYIDQIVNQIEKAFKGDNGEKQVADELHKILNPKQYTIYKNFIIPDKQFDIDFLIVGPDRLIALEVKNWSKPVEFYEDYYEVIEGENRDGRKIFRPKKDPRNALIDYGKQLQLYLHTQGFTQKIPIYKAIVLINAAIKIPETTPIYIIQGVKNLKNYSQLHPEFKHNSPSDIQTKLNQIFSKNS